MRNLIYIAMEKTTILKHVFITNHLFGHLSIAMLNNWRVLDGDITDMTNNNGNQYESMGFTMVYLGSRNCIDPWNWTNPWKNNEKSDRFEHGPGLPPFNAKALLVLEDFFKQKALAFVRFCWVLLMVFLIHMAHTM